MSDTSVASGVEIVLVEDDPNDAELIIRALKKHHLANSITLLRDGAEAVAYFESPGLQAPRVVLLDLKLPKLNGIEVLQRLRANDVTKTLPVVILTSSREEQDLTAAYALGVNSFVTKPIRFEEFSKVVADLGLYWMLINEPPV